MNTFSVVVFRLLLLEKGRVHYPGGWEAIVAGVIVIVFGGLKGFQALTAETFSTRPLGGGIEDRYPRRHPSVYERAFATAVALLFIAGGVWVVLRATNFPAAQNPALARAGVALGGLLAAAMGVRATVSVLRAEYFVPLRRPSPDKPADRIVPTRYHRALGVVIALSMSTAGIWLFVYALVRGF